MRDSIQTITLELHDSVSQEVVRMFTSDENRKLRIRFTDGGKPFPLNDSEAPAPSETVDITCLTYTPATFSCESKPFAVGTIVVFNIEGTEYEYTVTNVEDYNAGQKITLSGRYPWMFVGTTYTVKLVAPAPEDDSSHIIVYANTQEIGGVTVYTDEFAEIPISALSSGIYNCIATITFGSGAERRVYNSPKFTLIIEKGIENDD